MCFQSGRGYMYSAFMTKQQQLCFELYQLILFLNMLGQQQLNYCQLFSPAQLEKTTGEVNGDKWFGFGLFSNHNFDDLTVRDKVHQILNLNCMNKELTTFYYFRVIMVWWGGLTKHKVYYEPYATTDENVMPATENWHRHKWTYVNLSYSYFVREI